MAKRLVVLSELKSRAMHKVMSYLLDYQVDTDDDSFSDEQKVFLWLAQSLNTELRLRNPRRNNVLFRRLSAVLRARTSLQSSEKRDG